LPYNFEGLAPRLWLQMAGSVMAERVVYNSAHCGQMARESFGAVLNAPTMAALEAKSQVLRFGLVRDEDPVAPAATAATPPVVLYNHRFENYKHPEVTFEVLGALRLHAPTLQVWATQLSAQHLKEPTWTIDRVLHAPQRADYLQQIAVPAINITNSSHETFCISALDSVAAGHLLVAPRAVTFPELVPADYPYLFRSLEEQHAMLRHILGTWPQAYNIWRQPLQDHAHQHFRLRDYVQRYLALFAACEAEHRAGTPRPHIAKAMAKVWDTLPVTMPLSLHALTRLVQRASNTGDQAMTPTRVLREALTQQRVRVQLGFDAKGVTITRVKG
jgi:hypothetical protein